MDSANCSHDIEAVEMAEHPESQKTGLLEASALLVVWSLLVINEGTFRFMAVNPGSGIASGRPSLIVAILAAVLEVVFGIIGLFLGLYGLLLKTHNPRITKLCLIVQFVLGCFVFIVFVFVLPLLAILERASLLLPTSTVEDNMANFSILTSASFCLALLGGQFAFMSRMLTADGKKGIGSRAWAIFWNFNLALAGLWTVVTGSIVLQHEGSGLLDVPFVSSPNIGRSPALTVATGVLMFVWGVLGMGMSLTKELKAVRAFVAATGIVYVAMYLNYSILQLGLIPDIPAGVASLHAGLVFLTVFIGPYFLLKQSEEEQH